MKTHIAKRIVKSNSRKMGKLTDEYIRLAQMLSSMKPTKENEARARDIMDAAKTNRMQWQRLQDEVTELCRLEAFLKG